MADNSGLPSRSETTPLLHSVDRCGRPIDPEVLNIAQFIAVRAIPFAEGLIKDPALATSLLEESAASVSRVVRKRAQLKKPPIANLEAYLFRAYIRRVNTVRRKEILVSGAMTSLSASPDGTGHSEKLELKILADEFVTRCDPTTRDMFYRRIQGLSWKEIGKIYGISAHAAEARFSQQLNKVRRRLGLK
jgi:DNA-directed RNA polymerase specialized sigma24 family protein